MVGVYDGRELRQYVRGVNLHRFPEEMELCGLLVTFFGSGFDLPVLPTDHNHRNRYTDEIGHAQPGALAEQDQRGQRRAVQQLRHDDRPPLPQPDDDRAQLLHAIERFVLQRVEDVEPGDPAAHRDRDEDE